MIQDSSRGQFDYVIVWKMDRFARDRYDSANYKSHLKKKNIKVLSATENISGGSEGILMETLLEGMAEYFSAELAVKVNRGMKENALKCMHNGGLPPFGYAVDSGKHYQIDPVTAPVVRNIFTRYDRGETMKEIVDFLHAAGIKGPKKNELNINAIARILKNRKYIGEYSYRDVVIPDGIPALVEKDLFERVQARMAKNRRAPAQRKAEDDYLLSGMLPICGLMWFFIKPWLVLNVDGLSFTFA